MSENDVFLLSDSLGLVKMQERPYLREDDLQALLARHPDLLVASASGSSDRLLLVSREASVPDGEVSGGRWSVDHLFVDAEAIPILVEVKRSSDTRIRREMIGQMLDYAANAATFWTAEQLSGYFQATCNRQGENAEALIAELVGPDEAVATFWERVAANLDAGRIRLVFVADRVPLEVQRVVEYLNDQMSPTEVLAVEVRQYLGSEPGVKTIVPRLLGQTAKSKRRRKLGVSREPRVSDEASLLEHLSPEDGSVAADIVRWASEEGLPVRYENHQISSSAIVSVPLSQRQVRIVSITTDGSFRVWLNDLTDVQPFSDDAALESLVSRYRRIAGFDTPDGRLRTWKPFRLRILAGSADRRALFEALDYHVREIRRANA